MNKYIIIIIVFLLSVGETVAQGSYQPDPLTLITWQNNLLAYAKKTATKNEANINNSSKQTYIGMGSTTELERFIKMSKAAYEKTGNVNDLDIREHVKTVYPDLHKAYSTHLQLAITRRNREARSRIPEPDIPNNQ
ncbi:MAG: hypothetical protein AAFR66_14970 [Bacteroidota bacterium]